MRRNLIYIPNTWRDVVITQRTIWKKDYKEQVAIMFDNNRDCVLDNDVNFYVKEKQFFDAIKPKKLGKFT